MSDTRDPSELGERLLARRDPGSGFDRLVPPTLSELADAAPLDDVPAFGAGERESGLIEWVQWGSSLFHVRLSSGGRLACGAIAPATAAANSFPPTERKCANCLATLRLNDGGARRRAWERS